MPEPQPRFCIGRGFGWWTDSFRMMMAAAREWYLIGLVLVIVLFAIFWCSFVLFYTYQFLLCAFLLALLVFITLACLAPGLARAGEAQARGEKPKLSHLVGVFDLTTDNANAMMKVVAEAIEKLSPLVKTLHLTTAGIGAMIAMGTAGIFYIFIFIIFKL